MKVAIPLFGDRVSPRFAFAPEVLIAEIEGNEVNGRRRIPTGGMSPHQIVMVLAAQGAETIICAGIAPFCQNIVAARGIRLIPGIIGYAEEVLAAFIAGSLRPGPVGLPRGRRRRGRRGFRPPWRMGG